MRLQGIVRSKNVRTAIPDSAAACRLERVNRHLKAPHSNALWVSEFTDVAT